MAKITIAGDAVVVTSSMTLETLKLIEKYRPATLQMLDEDKKPVFVIGSTSSNGSVSSCGISFGVATHDEHKLASVTMTLPAGVADAEKYVVDTYGAAVMNLKKIENRVASAIESINNEIASVKECITLA